MHRSQWTKLSRNSRAASLFVLFFVTLFESYFVSSAIPKSFINNFLHKTLLLTQDRMWHDFVVPPEPLEDDDDLHVSELAWDLITRFQPFPPRIVDIFRLLEEPSRRLGRQGIDEIKQHPFFSEVNWNDPLRAEPPFIPSVRTF